MSENDRTYGIDIGYNFKDDGTVDLAVDESGDILLVGGTPGETREIRRKNAIQQIKLRILTNRKTLVDENGRSVEFGSDLYTLSGAKNNDLNKLAVKAYVISCLKDYAWIEAITKIDVDIPETGTVTVQLGIKLIDDNEIIEETINVSG